MLLVHIGIASLRQFQCAPTTYVNLINECFSPLFFFHKLLNYFLMFQYNEHACRNEQVFVLFGVHLDDNNR